MTNPGPPPGGGEQRPEQDRLGRMLSGGPASGPEIDARWAMLDEALDGALEGERAPKASWWARLMTAPTWARALAALPVAAALVVVPALLLTGEEEVTPRGTGVEVDVSGVRMVASCGAVEDPCPVGERVFFRLIGHEEARTVTITLEQPNADPVQFDDVAVPAGATVSWTTVVIPEADDVDGGLTFVVRSAGSTAEQPASRLHLEVQRGPMQREPVQRGPTQREPVQRRPVQQGPVQP